MQRQVRRDTKPELLLRRELHRRGLRYRVDQTVLPGTRRRHDLVFARSRVVVEVRGCFWHGCATHSTVPRANRRWWIAKIRANQERDADTEQRLSAEGWEVIVVWEHDGCVAAANRIERVVRRRARFLA